MTDFGLQDHEWTPEGDDASDGAAAEDMEDEAAVKDSVGSVLVNGDSVVTIRDLIADGKAVRAVRTSCTVNVYSSYGGLRSVY